MLEKKNWQTEIHTFLRNYRNTTHITTKVAPAEILFGRSLRIKFPSVPFKMGEGKHDTLMKTDHEAKMRMKDFADVKVHARNNELKIGDAALLKERKQNKLSSLYCGEPFEIVHIKGTMVTAKCKTRKVTRNAVFFKKVGKDAVKEYEERRKYQEQENVRLDNEQSTLPRGNTVISPAFFMPEPPRPREVPEEEQRCGRRNRRPPRRLIEDI